MRNVLTQRGDCSCGTEGPTFGTLQDDGDDPFTATAVVALVSRFFLPLLGAACGLRLRMAVLIFSSCALFSVMWWGGVGPGGGGEGGGQDGFGCEVFVFFYHGAKGSREIEPSSCWCYVFEIFCVVVGKIRKSYEG